MATPPNLSDLISERMSEFKERLTESERREGVAFASTLGRVLTLQMLVGMLIGRTMPDMIPQLTDAANLLKEHEFEGLSDGQRSMLHPGIDSAISTIERIAKLAASQSA